MDESDVMQHLYDRIEVLEKTLTLLLNRLNLEMIQHGEDYIELRDHDD
jgi:hypothetical protein